MFHPGGPFKDEPHAPDGADDPTGSGVADSPTGSGGSDDAATVRGDDDAGVVASADDTADVEGSKVSPGDREDVVPTPRIGKEADGTDELSELDRLEALTAGRMDDALHDGLITFDEAENIARMLRDLRRNILEDGVVDANEEKVLLRVRGRIRELLMAEWTLE
jgi:hypothetical protein